ncbi:MAG TPA: pyridoxal phosphate-dependent aminotransferase [Caulobacteraceae bacterium]|nr:pyridoxal phosphate-dependent aminotransferase [Caulobacteraceae bacterium]
MDDRPLFSETRAPIARDRVRALAASKVREVANAGFGLPDVKAFWFGEGDQPTPLFIREAAMAALAEGRTFYTHNHGTAALRAALKVYLERLHRRDFDPAALSITSSGVSALMVTMQALLDPGDRVVAVTPVWPNLVEIPRILGAEVTRVGLKPRSGRWVLDLDELLDAITPATRLLLINSPNNPTGWALSPQDRAAILAHCRRLGVWILTDDVYERVWFGAADGNGVATAPSFLTLADEEDRVVSTNSFSKAWRMTGWRLGWIVTPPALSEDLGKLLEYNTSCAPDFVQAGGVVALEQGEAYVQALRLEMIAKRDRVLAGLARLPRVETTLADGGLYAFFRIAGETDSVALAKRLITRVGLGLAPGAAFGPEGEGWLRWCFATEDAAMDDGLDRLAKYFSEA